MSDRRQSQFDDQPSAFTWAQVGVTGTAPQAGGPTGELGLLLEAIWIARASHRLFDPAWAGRDLHALDIQVLLVTRLTAPDVPPTASFVDLLGVSRSQIDKAINRLITAEMLQGDCLGKRGRRLRVTGEGTLLVDLNLRYMRRAAEIRDGAWKKRLARAPEIQMTEGLRGLSHPLGIDELREALAQLRQR